MKKLYAIVAIFMACSIGADAAVADVLATLDSRTAKTARHIDNMPSRTRQASRKAPAKAPEGTWKVLGEGTYCEDFLSQFSNVGEGLKWAVTIEQSETDPGWYRCMPYVSGPVTDLFEYPDNEAILYINATDPERVYCEDIYIYEDILISQLVAENEWDLEEGEEGAYGKLADGLFMFPAYGFAMVYGGQMSYSNVNGAFMVALPGVEVPDFSFSASAEGFCAPANEFEIDIKAGSDIAQVKTLVLPGVLEADDDDVLRAAAEGTVVTDLTKPVTVKLDRRGPNMCVAVALRSDGEIIGYRSFLMFAEDDEAGQWQSVGNGKFAEGIYYYGYLDENPVLTVEVQRHNTIDGYYRLVNPYATIDGDGYLEPFSHSGEGSHHHYIYINATDPDYVYIEPSPTGVVSDYGEGAVMSLGALYLGTALEQQAKDENAFGKLDPATGVITFTDETILLAEYDYENGEFVISNEGTRIELPAGASLSDATVTPDAAPEYFNLQGMRIDRPEAGTVVIRRTGSTVEKVLVK